MDLQKKAFPCDCREQGRMVQQSDLSRKVLLNCRNELYSLFPYLDGAFASLPYRVSNDTASLGTDGADLLFSPGYLIALYGSCPARLRRGYLHILLHLLFLHPFRRGRRDRQKWNLACDIAVEQIIRRERQPRLDAGETDAQNAVFAALGERSKSAEEIYEQLEKLPGPLAELEAAFLFDDHHLWELAVPESRSTWEHLLSYTGGSRRRGGGHAGTQAGAQKEQLGDIHRGTYDYGTYLRRFAVSREEMELDMDSFDYIYYTLGMEQLGNIPLIEPLEYREGRKLEQLVIAIDTSGSCSKEVVQDFLSQTYSILSQQENFFRKMQVHLVQCDCLVQSAVVIHSRQEWENYSRDITIQGRGGTDFTPVFRYVQQQREAGKLQNLKALLYFTDGDGFYPREKTDYETAFVFLHSSDKLDAVPAWATRLLIGDAS